VKATPCSIVRTNTRKLAQNLYRYDLKNMSQHVSFSSCSIENNTLQMRFLISDFEVDFAEVENRVDLDQAKEQNDPASCPAFYYHR